MRFLLKYTRRNDIPICAINILRGLTLGKALVVTMLRAVDIIPAVGSNGFAVTVAAIFG
jgi:hypothetical protein